MGKVDCSMRVAALCLIAFTVNVSAIKCTSYSSQAACSPTTINTLPSCASIDRSTVRSVFTVIGDYGLLSDGCEQNVAALVSQFELQYGSMDFVATVGDNNYWEGSCNSMHTNVGPYSRFFDRTSDTCSEPRRSKLASAHSQRFFPSLGNHDWDTFKPSRGKSGKLPYLQYFDYLEELGNGGLYYNMSVNAEVELFALNSNWMPGELQYDQQKAWLQRQLALSRAPFKLVYFHHAPYTTAQHDPPGDWMRWPYYEWGASVVLSGHQHAYERVERDDMIYVVNGLGGHPWLYSTSNMDTPNTCEVEQGSQMRYNSHHGALLGAIDDQGMHLCFYSVESQGSLIDSFSVSRRAAQPTGVPSTAPASGRPPPAALTTAPSATPHVPVPSSNDDDDWTPILAGIAIFTTVAALVAVVVGLYLNWKLKQPIDPGGWMPAPLSERQSMITRGIDAVTSINDDGGPSTPAMYREMGGANIGNDGSAHTAL